MNPGDATNPMPHDGAGAYPIGADSGARMPSPPPAVPMPPTKAPWYKRPGCLIPLIIVVVIILGIGSCTALLGKGLEEVEKESKREIEVVYEVEGTAPTVSVSYSSGESNHAMESGKPLPWRKEVTVTGFLKTARLTATSGIGEGGGDITCRILVDGKVKAEQTGGGDFASVTCSTGDLGEK